MCCKTYFEQIAAGADAAVAASEFMTRLTDELKTAGMPQLAEGDLKQLTANMSDKKNAVPALRMYEELASKTEFHGFLMSAIPSLINIIGDKNKKVRDQATASLKAIMEAASTWAGAHVLPMLIEGMKGKPAQKETCIEISAALARKNPKVMGLGLVELIPIVAELVWDVKKEVKTAAVEALEVICRCSGNSDLEGFIPTVVSALQQPETMPKAVEALAGCVFVQEMEAPAMAVLIPVLCRGLTCERVATKRQCCVIIDNMCKLVNDPKEVAPMMEKVHPILLSQKEGISDPEARTVADRAFAELNKAAGSEDAAEIDAAVIMKDLKSVVGVESDATGILGYACGLCEALSQAACWEEDVWAETLSVLGGIVTSDLKEKCTELLAKCKVAASGKELQWEESEGVDMCRAEFGLAYGARTLLNTTRLHLKRNRFYGLLGPNNCGKTTLMRAIAAEQVEGFPKQNELRTIFVEHEIAEKEVGEDAEGFPILNIDLTGADWVVDTCNNLYDVEPKVTREKAMQVMEDIGFGNMERGMGADRAADCTMLVTTYSGGWKMKMQLCAATLVNADLLMLDEPTGHLDVTNIAWIKDWLRNFMSQGGSVIATSHATAFLNEMCDQLIDFQERRLVAFRGTKGEVLAEFVEQFPEKKGYFELKNDNVKFVFPTPGALDGVKSKSKFLVKMNNVTFQYPSRDTPTVFNINLEASRVSRVAVIGANGAGKSTAIKLLTGELRPTSGEVTRHPNMRLAYVAQHAFQHLEKHLTKTPVQYILDRFAGNDDTEAVDFKAKEDSEDVKEKAQFFVHTATNVLKKCEEKGDFAKALVPEALLGRRENKKEKTREYNVKFQHKSMDDSLWVRREILVQMGCLRMVQREDEKQAMAAGLISKKLTTEGVEAHLKHFGLDAEVASHTSIQSLSGGQKVKVVLGASMWQDPHILILDEPTNYLDRDGLGALTLAIKDYEGGIIIISHNREFCNAVASEKWIMQAGQLRQEGESVETKAEDNGEQKEIKGQEELRDGFGNIIDMKEANKSDKEKKKELKLVEKKLKDNKKKKKTLSDEEMWELEDKLTELKTHFESVKGA